MTAITANDHNAIAEIAAGELARRDLLDFCERTIPDFQSPRHIRHIAELLEAVERGGQRRLLITLHPGSGKSWLLQAFAAWYLGRHSARLIDRSWVFATIDTACGAVPSVRENAFLAASASDGIPHLRAVFAFDRLQAREATKRAAPNYLHREDFRPKEAGDEGLGFLSLCAHELCGRCNAGRVRRIAAADRCAGRDAAERGGRFRCDSAPLHLSP